MCGSTQLRVSSRFGRSALFRYANMKSVPGLVTIISSPSNLTSMSMMKPYHKKKGRADAYTPHNHLGYKGSPEWATAPGLDISGVEWPTPLPSINHRFGSTTTLLQSWQISCRGLSPGPGKQR